MRQGTGNSRVINAFIKVKQKRFVGFLKVIRTRTCCKPHASPYLCRVLIMLLSNYSEALIWVKKVSIASRKAHSTISPEMFTRKHRANMFLLQKKTELEELVWNGTSRTYVQLQIFIGK